MVDRGRWFLPEHLTHLYYAPPYDTLTPEQRLRYNQLFACYFNEQLMFFELNLIWYLRAILSDARVTQDLCEGVRALIVSEERHTAMYRALNRDAEPERYAGGDFYFIRVPRWGTAILRGSMRAPRLFPLYIWLMLLEEERSLYYSREILAHRTELDPRFVQVNTAHMQDEAEHVDVNERLLDLYWDRSHAWIRNANARLFEWLVDEYFNAPKRAGVAVVRELVGEFPDLGPRRDEMVSAIRALRSNDVFHRNQYSRAIVPRVFAHFDRRPEFKSIGRVLRGYAECGADPWSERAKTPPQKAMRTP
ncbi:MAG: diiron oxygenase [Bryobacteraceae bacterium]